MKSETPGILFDFLQEYTISGKLRYFTVIFASHKMFSVLLAKIESQYIVLGPFIDIY